LCIKSFFYDCVLSFDDINHYRNIIAVLLRTAELMQDIDNNL